MIYRKVANWFDKHNDVGVFKIFRKSDEKIPEKIAGTNVEDGSCIWDVDLGILNIMYNDELWPVDGGGSSSQGSFVGNVKKDGSFPTTRPSGLPLQNEDYVRPIAPFPFTIDGIEFKSTKDKAYYINGVWSLDAGVIQETSETPVSDPTTESISGTANRQNVVNQLFKTAIEDLQSRLAYVYVQNTASDNWSITHNLGYMPNITIIDSAGNTCEGTITYTDTNNVVIEFCGAFSGKAYLS